MSKILILADTPTHPVTAGNRRCILDYCALLEELRHEIHFMLVDQGDLNMEEVKATGDFWQDKFHYFRKGKGEVLTHKVLSHILPSYRPVKVDDFYPKRLNTELSRLHKVHNFDLMIVNYIWLSKAALCTIPRKAIFTHDVFTNRSKRIKSGYSWKSFSASQEAKAVERFNAILAIQDHEAIYFSYLAPSSTIHTVYSPSKYIEQSLTYNKNILFFSSNGDLNVVGLNTFLNDVWPSVIERQPEARLLVGGSICKSASHFTQTPGVDFLGIYDNPDDFYAEGDIVINPVFSGSGLKIKTIEALAHGKTVIVHPHSAEGLYKPMSCPVIKAPDAESFIKNLLTYLSEPTLREKTKQLGQDYIQKYNEYISAQYQSLICSPIS